MGKGRKAKGSRYERELVALVMDEGLQARRVPLSGAMKNYKDDVVVMDAYRVECKYRADGENFSRLHDWIDGYDILILPESQLLVYTFEAWIAWLVAKENGDGTPLVSTTTREVSTQKKLLDWLGESDFLALRRARKPWLICRPTA